MIDYDRMYNEIESLVSGVPYEVADLANVSAYLYHAMDRVSWVGFYLIKDGRLVLGPFQGKPACIEIPMGRGVCGAAAERRETVVVPDVHAFPGHIACDSESRSEIVVPLVADGGRVLGVLDIDSTEYSRFGECDRIGLERICTLVVREVLTK
jgi:GAF domain-containing protein